MKVKRVGPKNQGNESGTAMAEAVIAVPLFVFLVFMAIEFMVISWRTLTLQFLATQAMRNIATGMCWNAGQTASEFCEDANRRRTYAVDQARALAASYGLNSPHALEVCVSSATAPLPNCADDPSIVVAGSLIEIRTTFESPLLIGKFKMSNGGGTLRGLAGSSNYSYFSMVGRAIGRVEGRQRS